MYLIFVNGLMHLTCVFKWWIDEEMRIYHFGISQIVASTVSALTIVAVLVAAWKNRMQKLLLPWLVLQILSIVTQILFSLYSGIIAVQANRSDVGLAQIIGGFIAGGTEPRSCGI